MLMRMMKKEGIMTAFKKTIGWCAALCLAALCQGAGARELYVAAQGSDAGDGSSAKPFATLARARDEVRKLKAAAPGEAMTVNVGGGIYALPQGIKFDSRDSGSAAAPVTWRAQGAEKPVLIGGREIKGFTPWRGQILKADLSAQGFQGAAFHQLIFDGKRMHLARYPNFDESNPYGGGWAYADGKLVPMYQDIPGEDQHTLTAKAADLHTWAKPAELEVFVFARYNWWNNICRVKAIDPETRKVTLAQNASYAIRPGDRYYFQNALEELDTPGEWYLDRATSTLYFWPPSPLAGRAVVAPATRTILDLGAGTSHVTFRGFTFECASGTAIVLTNTTECRIAGCTIRNVGDYSGSGVSVNGGVKNGIVGCDIHDIGSHGISLGGGDRKKLIAAENYADNNYIHHFGLDYKQGVGVSLTGCGNRASHNLIHDGPRMGIQFAGNNLIIEYNHIRHMNLETEDTGAVYTGGRDWLGSRGTVIRYNYFHDMLGYGHDAKGAWQSPYFAWGVYLDDNTGGVDVIGNIVVRCPRAAMHLHNGRDNHVENNIFAEAGLYQMEFSGWTPAHRYWSTHLPTMIQGYESVMNEPAWKTMRNMDVHPKDAVLPNGMIMTGNEIFRNIFYYSDPKSKYVRENNFPFDHNKIDQNVVWHKGQPVLTGQVGAGKAISENLVANPGFESGPGGGLPADWSWQVRPVSTAKALAVAGGAASGQRALRIDAAFVKEKKRDNAPIIGSKYFTLQPGHSYRVSVKLKATAPGAKASLTVHAYKGAPNGFYWGNNGKELTPGAEWKEYTASFRVPAPGDQGYHEGMEKLFRVAIGFKGEAGALLADDVDLREVESLDEWQSWQAVGMDKNSVIADPLFVDAAKDDWRLKEGSPALKLGFKPIPVEKIGPYADELRASWPIVEAEGAREKPLK